MGVRFELPWPPASLSGHNTGHWRAKSGEIAKLREWAIRATLAVRNQVGISLADDSDVPIAVTFHPPDRRGDRVNFPNRMKPYFDGIADALCINDRRFLPEYHFGVVVPRGKIIIEVANG